MAGTPERLRPHVKTHKCPQVVAMKLESGISKFKCSTPAEVKMLAQSGAKDILLAYQPVGPNVQILIDLIETFPDVHISCIIDSSRALADLASACSSKGITISVFIDIDVGMSRTGVKSLDSAVALAKEIRRTPGAVLMGIHAYDGHNTDFDPNTRKTLAQKAVAEIEQLQDRLTAEGIKTEEIVVGGTPMFPQYTGYKNLTLSPGTLFLHDSNSAKYPDLPFEFGAMILSRVVSLPEKDVFTLDAGSKSLSMDHPDRAVLLSMPDAQPGLISEEHSRYTCGEDVRPGLGEVMYLVPAHVCTAVHHFDKAYVILDDGKLTDIWAITARGRI